MKFYNVLLLTCFLIKSDARKHQKRPDFQLRRPIVGGSNAEIINFPYQVSLGAVRKIDISKNEFDYKHFCGGSIISVEWVLTAAHCVKFEYDEDRHLADLRVRVGSNVVNEGGSLHEFAQIIVHSGFDFTHIDFDIAVIKVKKPFEFGPTVQPIPLNKNPLVVGGIATVSGWGSRTGYGGKPLILQKVQIPIMPQWECKMRYQDGDDQITNNMFCAGRAARSACYGDSGGPVVYRGVQIGIVSWGKSCQRPDYSGVYTNVYSLRDWIHKNTGV